MASTRRLRCDPTSISFDNPLSIPNINDRQSLDALTLAVEILNKDEPVALPTETVYGLGANALSSSAVAKIFAVKGRPQDNPLIVHVSSRAMLESLLPAHYTISAVYNTLISRFWPGPLTLLFPVNRAVIPSEVTAGRNTVAIRMPSHPVARALIAMAKFPLAAPSANSSGRPSPTRADHVMTDLKDKLAVVLDDGQSCQVGLESTVVDGLHPDGNIRVLRPGGVTAEDIEQVVRESFNGVVQAPKVLVYQRDYKDSKQEEAPTTPGMKYQHYAPSAPVVLLRDSRSAPPDVSIMSALAVLDELKSRTPKQTLRLGLLLPSDSLLRFALERVYNGVEWQSFSLGPTADPSLIAARLFDGLLSLDGQGVHFILMEEIKEEREGLAVMNRVRKAAAESHWITYS